MNVLCPSCGTGYEIPEAHLRRPRKLRCATCGNEWRVAALVPTEPESLPHPPAPDVADSTRAEDPEPPMVRDDRAGDGGLAAPVFLPLAPTPPPPDRPSAAGLLWTVLWLASLVLIGAGVFALWHWRIHVGQHWPASRRIYRLLPGAP